MLESILRGAIDGVPNGHAVYMRYPLTALLSWLYKWPGSDVHLATFFVICICLGVFCLMTNRKKGILSCILAGLLAFLVLGELVVYTHYTIIAAVMAGAGICWWIRDSKIRSVLCLALCLCIRSQIFLLSLPFLGVAMLSVFLMDQKDARKRIVKNGAITFGVLAIVLVAVLGLDKFMYRDPAWSEYLHYNDVRTELYDFTNIVSVTYPEETVKSWGLTTEQYDLLRHYDLILDRNMDVETMEKALAGVRLLQVERSLSETIKQALHDYWLRARYYVPPMALVVYFLYFLVFVLCIMAKKYWGILPLGCLGVGRSLICMYFLAAGRFPERVELSILTIEAFLLWGMAYLLWEKIPEKFVSWMMAGSAIVFLGLAVGFTIPSTKARVEAQGALQEDWEVLKEYCFDHSENLYLCDVFSIARFGDYQYEEPADNLLFLGGWITGSPLVENRFSRYLQPEEQTEDMDGSKLLLNRENVFLVVDDRQDISWMENYFVSRFGEETKLCMEKEIECAGGKFYIYSLKSE